MSQFVLDISKIDKRDMDIAGKYAVELGELSHIGIPILEGFVVTASCFREFLAESKFDLLSAEKQILHAEMSNNMSSQINKAYRGLGSAFKESKVVLNLSSPFSFNNTHFEVKGDANLIHKIKEIWAKQFSKISILENRISSSNDFHKLDIAILIQKKIESEKNGTLYTEDPLTSDKTKIVIREDKETSHYLIEKENLHILFKGHLIKSKRSHKISDKEAVKLAIIGKKIEKYYYFPQEVKFSIDKGKIYILETKPMTNFVPKPDFHSVLPRMSRKSKINANILMKGISNFPGIATGHIRIIVDSNDIRKILPGEIIVVSTMKPDLFSRIKKAGAIIIKKHSFTALDKLLYRKVVGKPSIIDVKNASQFLHSGNVVTVNGERGEIYKGGL